jgi:hypothetical protein
VSGHLAAWNAAIAARDAPELSLFLRGAVRMRHVESRTRLQGADRLSSSCRIAVMPRPPFRIRLGNAGCGCHDERQDLKSSARQVQIRSASRGSGDYRRAIVQLFGDPRRAARRRDRHTPVRHAGRRAPAAVWCPREFASTTARWVPLDDTTAPSGHRALRRQPARG